MLCVVLQLKAKKCVNESYFHESLTFGNELSTIMGGLDSNHPTD